VHLHVSYICMLPLSNGWHINEWILANNQKRAMPLSIRSAHLSECCLAAEDLF
jgi:hypothetical protein